MELMSHGKLNLFKLKQRQTQTKTKEITFHIHDLFLTTGMSAQMCKDTIRTFLSRLYPLKSEGIDYRVPSITMLLRWRRLLEPVCHFIALSAIDQAHLVHVLSDACTKRHVGVFHVNVKIEVSPPSTSLTLTPSPLHFFISALLFLPYWLCLRLFYLSLCFV